MLTAKIHHYSEALTLIELTPPLAGFDQFIGAWLYRGDLTFLVDVGPAVTAPALLAALGDLQVTQLDYILLTHIHIDHAGGIGEVSAHFPKTPVISHEKARQHLADPTRLWQGSVKNLGDTARAYGPIKAVPEHLLVPASDLKSDTVASMATPGHAPHHISYRTAEYLFAGETGGVCLSLPDGRSWLRPATPPRFFLTTALSSLDTLAANTPDTICYGHLGIQNHAVQCLARHREQLLLWEKLIGREIKGGPRENFFDRCLDCLLAEDPELAAYDGLTPDQQSREKYFLGNSIKGFVGYLDSPADNP